MTAGEVSPEPTAAASPEARRRFLTLTGLFLAGPSIWMSHFLVVYLVAEAVCAGDVDVEVASLPLVSALTLVATAVAAGAAGTTTLLAYRRWRRAPQAAHPEDANRAPAGDAQQDPQVALAGFLLGVLFVVAILFVGLPAAVLEPC